jgi:hypothetical protein
MQPKMQPNDPYWWSGDADDVHIGIVAPVEDGIAIRHRYDPRSSKIRDQILMQRACTRSLVWVWRHLLTAMPIRKD